MCAAVDIRCSFRPTILSVSGEMRSHLRGVNPPDSGCILDVTLHPTDADLVTLAQCGDVSALATVFQRHRPMLYATAIGILADREEAADAVQDTFVTALTQITSVHDPAAIGGRLRGGGQRVPDAAAPTTPTPMEHLPDLVDPDLDPEQLVLGQATRDWIWSGLAALSADERLTLLLRHFSRCASYQAIAEVTAVPVGTVHGSGLHRAHTRLAHMLQQVAADAGHDQRRLEAQRLAAWQDFYDVVWQAPEPHTYRSMFQPDVQVRDDAGTWTGIEDWVAEERPAIELGVRAEVVGLTAVADLTLVEIDFTNPVEAPHHCPPRSTFVHRLRRGRTQELAIPLRAEPSRPHGPVAHQRRRGHVRSFLPITRFGHAEEIAADRPLTHRSRRQPRRRVRAERGCRLTLS